MDIHGQYQDSIGNAEYIQHKLDKAFQKAHADVSKLEARELSLKTEINALEGKIGGLQGRLSENEKFKYGLFEKFMNQLPNIKEAFERFVMAHVKAMVPEKPKAKKRDMER